MILKFANFPQIKLRDIFFSSQFLTKDDPNITVGQNIRFEYAEQVPPRWIVQVVKHWFLEDVLKKSGHW